MVIYLQIYSNRRNIMEELHMPQAEPVVLVADQIYNQINAIGRISETFIGSINPLLAELIHKIKKIFE